MIITIDGKKIETENGKTVLEAALKSGIYIPNLCYHPDISPVGACRLCIVEIEGFNGYPASCTTKVREGMSLRTNAPEILELRKNIMWLILSEHSEKINKSSQLWKAAEWIGFKQMLHGFSPVSRNLPVISDEPLFIRDMNKCILCGRCVRMCQEIRGTGAIGLINRGVDTIVGTNFGLPMEESGCKFCLGCVEVCPSGALADKEEFDEDSREQKLVPCKNTCPAGIDIPRYVKFIADGRFQDALEVVREKVPFPAVLGHVCHHPCEEECRRSELNEPIAIKALKRFAAGRDSGRWHSKVEIAPETGRKAAIVGSGPAGLTAAWFLRISGHSVTVFEALPEAGGMMRTGIPKYRLPEEVLNKEIKDIENAGVRINTNTRIESLDELFQQGFDAVFLAPGASEGMKMGIPGEDYPQVLDGISVLRDINLGKEVEIGGEVAVVGGGNVALDAARSALRVGAKKVTILYRRTRSEMPAADEEVNEALEEGIEIKFLLNPEKVARKSGKLEIECIRMQLGKPDSSGRRKPVPIEGSEFTITSDRLIIAIGQKIAIPKKFGCLLDSNGKVQVDSETLSSSRKGVFSGGDAVSGPASVIEAVESGRKAAISIDKYLGGKGRIDHELVPEEEENPCLGREEDFANKKRVEITAIPVKERSCNFRLVEQGIGEEEAVEEAKRCLKCQLRLKISRAPFPP